MIIELLGPPGVGKSTLMHRIQACKSTEHIYFAHHDASYIDLNPYNSGRPYHRLIRKILPTACFSNIRSRVAVENLVLDEERNKLACLYTQLLTNGKEIHDSESIWLTLKIFLQSLNVNQALSGMDATVIVDEGLLQRGHSLSRHRSDASAIHDYYHNVMLPDRILYCFCDQDVWLSRNSDLKQKSDLVEQCQKNIALFEMALEILNQRGVPVTRANTGLPWQMIETEIMDALIQDTSINLL